MNPRIFLFVLVALFPFLTSADQEIGGWFPIKNLNDSHVIEIAKFAISEYNKQSKTNLTFDKVVKGETQVVSGTIYRLFVSVQNGAATEQYEALVWEKSWLHFKKLISFKHVLKYPTNEISEDDKLGSISNNVGGWVPIKDLTDPHVIEIAQFAVSEHNKTSRKNLKLEKVVEGKKQIVSGINYRLVVVVQNGDATEKYGTEVLEKPWKHSITLISFTPAQ